MNRLKKQTIFEDMKNGVKPCCLPMDVIGFAEYRKDIYNQGERDTKVKEGEIAQSSDGNKKYTKDGGIWDLSAKKKYRNYEDIINVDPKIFPVEDINHQMLVEMEKLLKNKNETHVVFPWHYGTLLTRCQIHFGWEPLLEASALEPDKLNVILERITASTEQVLKGWSSLDDVYMIIVHDDIAATKGLIWSPDFLRKYIFPKYKQLFDTIHEKGKKVLYITDGNYSEVLSDILELSPDGLFIESSSINPETVMEAGGDELFYLLKTDSRTMDYGSKKEILEEVLRIKELHEKYPKIFSYNGGGLVKPENLRYFRKIYNEYLVY